LHSGEARRHFALYPDKKFFSLPHYHWLEINS
jgi:hypothetical protein